jgi:hypothetical protein
MKRVCLIVLITMGWVMLVSEPGMAKRVYFAPDGTPLVGEPSAGNEAPNRPLSRAERMARDAAAAAAAGYALGQTVKVENGIIYKLARDPKTGAYTFTLYRRVVKPKPSPPARTDSPSTTDLEKDRQEARAREIRRQADLAAEKARLRDVERRQEEARLENERLEQQRQEKKAAEEARIRAEEDEARARDAIRTARIAAENEAIRKAEEDALARERRRSAGQPARWSGNSGRIMEHGRVALSLEHSFFNRETLLKHRTVTTAAGTVSDSGGLGVKDVFYTDVHTDMLTLRYGILGRLEVFVEAGMVFETLDEISAMEPAWAAGFRAALFRYDLTPYAGLFVNGSGRYYAGEVSGRFTDLYGFTYDKMSEFTEIEAGIETGLCFYNLTVYAGLSWAAYTEDTVKIQTPVQPGGTRLDDRLEEQDSLIVKAGAEYRFLTNLAVYLEANALNREGLLAGFSWRF